MNQRTAVWITGVGAVTPLGHAYDDIADSLLEGRSSTLSSGSGNQAQHRFAMGLLPISSS